MYRRLKRTSTNGSYSNSNTLVLFQEMVCVLHILPSTWWHLEMHSDLAGHYRAPHQPFPTLSSSSICYESQTRESVQGDAVVPKPSECKMLQHNAVVYIEGKKGSSDIQWSNHILNILMVTKTACLGLLGCSGHATQNPNRAKNAEA